MTFTYGSASLLLIFYSEFTKRLTTLRVYCLGRVSGKFEDYFNLYAYLGDSYLMLKVHAAPEQVGHWKDPIAEELFSNLDAIFRSGKLAPNDLETIANLIANFEDKHEIEFRERWLDACNSKEPYRFLSHGLDEAVTNLLKKNEYDAAVVAAFKHLDGQLQKALGVPPHEQYGEKLINLAFAPHSGKLQLGTSESEQLGLRNFFSGAYAIFRNPSAHRFVKYTAFSALTIINMVAMMEETVRSLKPKKKRGRQGEP
jgi:uncharacterized protein (TIGR02391 family)